MFYRDSVVLEISRQPARPADVTPTGWSTVIAVRGTVTSAITVLTPLLRSSAVHRGVSLEMLDMSAELGGNLRCLFWIALNVGHGDPPLGAPPNHQEENVERIGD